MNIQISLLRVILLAGLAALGAAAQTVPLTTRDADGKLVFQRQNAGAYLGAYLGDAGGKRGAKVGKVLADSPAAKAGLAENDLVVGLATERIENAAQVYQWLNTQKPAQKPAQQPSDSVALRVRRNGAELTLNVTLSERRVRGDDPCQKLLNETNAMLSEAERRKALAEEAARKGDKQAAEDNAKEADALFKQAEASRLHIEQAVAEGRTSMAGRKDTCSPASLQPAMGGLGLEVAMLTPQLASYFGLKATAGTAGGLLVTDVFNGAPAAQAGFKAGDCLLSLNEKAVANAFELRRTFEEADEPMLSASILRDGQSLTLSVKRR